VEPSFIALLKQFQENEITEYHIYKRIANAIGNANNREVLLRIAEEEKRHYAFWKRYSKEEVKPSGWRIFVFTLLAKLLGLTFALKLLEKNEEWAHTHYSKVLQVIPEAQWVIEEEEKHEEELLQLIEEEKLNYLSSIVLGLNDALVELLGTLAGLTLALSQTKWIGIIGFITGFAASLSMASSEYLSVRAEESPQKALRSAFYTGLAYLFTVLLMILPYLFFSNPYYALLTTFAIVILIIAFFTFYISIARNEPFRQRFWEMLLITIGVAILSFSIGLLIRMCFNLNDL